MRDRFTRDLGSRAAAALRIVAGPAADSVIDLPTGETGDPRGDVARVARNSGIRVREVSLVNDWWRRDIGPAIVWPRHVDAKNGVEIFPTPMVFSRGRYWAVDPRTHRRTRLNEAKAASFAESAIIIQPPLPSDAGFWKLLRWAALGTHSDFSAVVISGVLVAVSSFGTPLIMALFLSHLLDAQSRQQTVDLALAVISGLLASAFSIIMSLRSLRFEDRIEAGIQLALWDRLVRLPAGFFSTTPTGALAEQILTVAYLRRSLQGAFSRGLAAFLAAITGAALIMEVDPRVAKFDSGLLAAIIAFSGSLGVRAYAHQRHALPAELDSRTLTHEMLAGTTKIRIAAAEARLFDRWFDTEAAARHLRIPIRRIQAFAHAAVLTLPIASQLLLFTAVSSSQTDGPSVGHLFELSAAMGMQIPALIVLISSGVELLMGIPRLSGIARVLAATPEPEGSSRRRINLNGRVEVQHVSYRYPGQPSLVVEDVSFSAQPGEFVAIVGPSGSGKSTLLRLLLGFESPHEGRVLFDGNDLNSLNAPGLRSQFGVVLQDSRLFAGRLWENICVARPCRMERVWAAAKLAGLDRDIERMPLGMNTLIPFDGATLSAGQRQRVMIARALYEVPKVLFFDEATSALDNRTQHFVSSSIRGLKATRVVIAHRLSTIIDADLILVMDRGEIVQRGRYEDLMADRCGLFHQLASRQIMPGYDC